jgi:hypothetical protein
MWILYSKVIKVEQSMEGLDEELEEDVPSEESSEPDVVKGICSLSGVSCGQITKRQDQWTNPTEPSQRGHERAIARRYTQPR